MGFSSYGTKIRQFNISPMVFSEQTTKYNICQYNISAYMVYVVRHACNVDSVGTGLLCLFVYLLCYAAMQQCS